MANSIEEQTKLLAAASKALAESHEKAAQMRASQDEDEKKELLTQALELKKRAAAAKELHKNAVAIENASILHANERTKMVRASIAAEAKISTLQKELNETKETATEKEISDLEKQITDTKDQNASFKTRQNEIDTLISDPNGPLRSLFSNMNKGLTGGLKSLSSNLGEMFGQTGAGKALNIGAKLLGKDGIRSMFEDPQIRAMRHKTETEEKERRLEGLDDAQKEELERREELGTAGRLAENLIGGAGKLVGLDVSGARQDAILEEDRTSAALELGESNDLLDSIETSLRGSPPYLLTISQTLIGMASNLKTITDAMTGQIDSEGAGKKERAFEEQKRHDELVRAQSEGDSIGDSPEVKIKGGGFLEKLGTNVGTGLKSIIDGIFGAIKAFIDGIGSLLNAALKIVQNFVNKVGNIIQSIAKTISKTFVTLMKGLGQGIAFFFRAIGSVPISAILKGALVLGIITVALMGLSWALRKLTPVFEVFSNMFISVLGKVVEFARTVILPIFQIVSDTILGLFDRLIGFVQTVGDVVISGINAMTTSITALAQVPFGNLAKIAAGFATLGGSLFVFGLASAIAVRPLKALGAASTGLAKLLDHEPERLKNMAAGFKILGKSVKGFEKDAKDLGGIVLSMTALSVLPFANKLIDLAIAQVLNVTGGTRENITSASNTNVALRDAMIGGGGELNQVNAVTNNTNVVNSSNMFIKPKIRDNGFAIARGQTAHSM